MVPEETVLRQFGVDCSFFVCTHARITPTHLHYTPTQPTKKGGGGGAKDTDTVWVAIPFSRFIQGHSKQAKRMQRDKFGTSLGTRRSRLCFGLNLSLSFVKSMDLYGFMTSAIDPANRIGLRLL